MKLILLIKNLFVTIRILNLAIICFSLLLVRHTLVIPLLAFSELSSGISENSFLLLMFATVLIAAGGYIINDYFDSGIDVINKPGKNKSEIYFTRREMLLLYFTSNFIEEAELNRDLFFSVLG